MKGKFQYITPVIWVLSLVSLFTDIASEMLYPVMPVFLKSVGFSILLIGLLEGLAEATAGLSKGYFGHLSDHLGKRLPFIRWGYGISAFSKPLMAVFTFPVWIFLFRTADRFGKGLRTSARDALLSDNATAATKGRVFGFHRAMDTLGAVVGPLLALVFLIHFPENYRLLFFLAFIPGLAAVFLTLKLKGGEGCKDNHVKRPGFLSFIGYWRKASLSYRWFIAAFILFAMFNSSDVFLLLFLKEKLGSDELMIYAYIYYNLIYALLAYPLGIWADRIGLTKMLAGGLIVFAMVYLLIGHADLWIHFALLFLAYGIFAAATEGLSKAWITNITPKHETATALGLMNSLNSIAALIASALTGLIWYTCSPAAAFSLSGLVAVVAACILLLMPGSNNKGKFLLFRNSHVV